MFTLLKQMFDVVPASPQGWRHWSLIAIRWLTLLATIALFFCLATARIHAEEHNDGIAVVSAKVDDLRKDVDQLSAEVREHDGALNRITGMGMGLGSVLVILQIAQMVVVKRATK